MHEESGSFQKAFQKLRTDLCSVRGVISRIPQLIALILLFGMLATVLHKLNADISLIVEQNPDDLFKAILRYLISSSVEGPQSASGD